MRKQEDITFCHPPTFQGLDRLPVPEDSEDADLDGPGHFPTQSTWQMVGGCGWTKGHAHMGLYTLCHDVFDKCIMTCLVRSKPNSKLLELPYRNTELPSPQLWPPSMDGKKVNNMRDSIVRKIDIGEKITRQIKKDALENIFQQSTRL